MDIGRFAGDAPMLVQNRIPPVFVIMDNDALAHSLGRYFRYVRGVQIVRLPSPSYFLSSSDLHDAPVQAFWQIADALESQMVEYAEYGQALAFRKAMVIVDLHPAGVKGDLKGLNPLAVGGDGETRWACMVAMLVLAFPEIHWVFVTGAKTIDAPLFRDTHILGPSTGGVLRNILEIHEDGCPSLFDATNFRHTIRQNIRAIHSEEHGPSYEVPIRPHTAAAIDEEPAYAYMNAYTAYRFGYRAWAITSWRMMERVFSCSQNSIDQPDPEIIFEDLYLNFPDRPPNIRNFSNLNQRDSQMQGLGRVRRRVLITVGHRRSPKDKEVWRENLSYLRASRVEFMILYKPFAGIFDLWKRAGMYKLNGKPRLASDFQWPPKWKQDASLEIWGGHSAPGRILCVTQVLIRRAEKILRGALTVEDAIHAAVLALDAKELLGNRTPTTALEALSIQHRAEVTAECMFYGTEYDFDVKSRFNDLQQEVWSIGRWFSSRTRKRSVMNAMANILSQIVTIFRNYGQFDEENECLCWIRRLHRRIWLSRNPWFWPFYPVRAYIDGLLHSLTRFVLAIAGWILLFAVVYWFIGQYKERVDVGFATSLVLSAQTFLSLQPPDPSERPPIPMVWFLPQAVLGFIHLGIFISHLYMRIMRR